MQPTSSKRGATTVYKKQRSAYEHQFVCGRVLLTWLWLDVFHAHQAWVCKWKVTRLITLVSAPLSKSQSTQARLPCLITLKFFQSCVLFVQSQQQFHQMGCDSFSSAHLESIRSSQQMTRQDCNIQNTSMVVNHPPKCILDVIWRVCFCHVGMFSVPWRLSSFKLTSQSKAHQRNTLFLHAVTFAFAVVLRAVANRIRDDGNPANTSSVSLLCFRGADVARAVGGCGFATSQSSALPCHCRECLSITKN